MSLPGFFKVTRAVPVPPLELNRADAVTDVCGMLRKAVKSAYCFTGVMYHVDESDNTSIRVRRKQSIA
jgi:hypothetical protein